MRGRSPKAVNAGPGPKSSKCRTEARCGVEAQKWGRSPMKGQSPKVGSEPDAGPKPNVGPEPNAVNAGLEPDVGAKPDVGPEPNAVNAGSIGMCKKCESKGFQCKSVGKRTGLVGVVRAHQETCIDALSRHVDRPSGHNSSCRGERVKAASGLPAKVGTTLLSCGVEGHEWPARESRHDSPVLRGGWLGWTRLLVIAHLAMEK
ncbi:hypothetical protein CDL15_Pgr000870 [Punica granatum]|uniref:Uncharacterized protein n=1 Tax=Punica granatum TaxID=22663 RepID=A0A218XYJ1_PUNGR|nr:hypothetical protein CDL15_Pgr000870 [Punica granatum]